MSTVEPSKLVSTLEIVLPEEAELNSVAKFWLDEELVRFVKKVDAETPVLEAFKGDKIVEILLAELCESVEEFMVCRY